MANTTLQDLITSVRASYVLDPTKVNFGRADGLTPPYATVGEYSHEWDRDTQVSPGLGGVKVARFVLVVVGKNIDEAERTAADLDAFINNNTALTPKCIGCLQDTWESGLVDPADLYQSGVRITYTLWEDPNKS